MSDVINVKIIGDLAYVNGVTDEANTARDEAKQAATDAENFLNQMRALPADLEILNQGNSLGTGVDSINFKGSGVVASKLQDGVFEVTVTATGGGSSDTAEDIRDKLESLNAGQRLDADHIDETANRKFISALDRTKLDKTVTKASESPEDDRVAVWAGGELKAGPAMDNSPSSLVKLDGTSKLPPVDGSQLTNLPLVDYSVKDVKFEGNNIVFEFNDGSRVVLNNAKIDLKGDKGDTGSQGLKGDTGATGPAGADGVGGYADKGALNGSDNPQIMEAGFYYVTEKFIGAPTISSGYVGHMMIQDKIDDPNGRLIVYFTSAGIYYQQKFAGGWEAWLNTTTAGFRPAAPVRSFTKFAGIFQNLSELTTFVTNPQAGEQAILLDPDDAYFEYKSGLWSKLASVSDVHDLYLGIFATQSELDSNHASPDEGSLAIVGDDFKYYEKGQWVDYKNHDVVGITSRLNVAEQHLQTLQQDGIKQDSEIKALQDDKIEYINVGDGATTSRGVKRILFNGYTVSGIDSDAEVHIEFLHFKNIQERDDWQTRFKDHVDFDVVAVVDADDNGFVAWYKFNAATKLWEEYDAQGVVMSDSNGAIPKNIKTVVFGPGFAIQQAGDQEDAALVTYSGGSATNGDLTVSQDWGKSAESTKVNAIQTMYPIEVNQNQIGDTPLEGNAMFSIDPRAYEMQHGNACLVKLDMVTTVAGQHPHAIYMSEEVVPTGEYFNLNAQGRGIDVQDSTGGDTAETGGQMTEVLVKVSFLDTAPEDGIVNVWLEYKDPSDVIAKKILLDVNGNPLAVGRHCNAGDNVGDFIIAGAFMAKATQPLKVMVETEFDVNSKITLDPVNTMVCLNQFSNGYETSVARIEFLRRAAIQITPAIQKFDNKMLSLSNELKGVNQILTIIGAGDAGDTLNEFGIQNLTSVGVKIENDTLTVKEAGSIADFYVDTLIDNTHTIMLRGKQITSAITIANPDGAFEYEAYKWTGKPDHVTQVYSGRNNGTITINDGWTVIKGVFIAEQVNGNAYGHVLTFDVHEDANNILILVRPQMEQSPSTLELQEFDWGTTTDFTGYVEIERYKSREEHYRFDESYGEYALNNTGYQALRYTINNTPATGNPMPVGVLLKGKAPIAMDNTVNQVGGSIDPAHDGAIKFLKDGEASISKSYSLWNEQGTDNTVTFWDVLIDIDGNETKIPESEKTFTVKANTGSPGVVYSIPAYAVDVETGQRIGGRATSNKADGAYVQSQNVSEYIVQTVIDFKELVADASDDPDLVSAPIPKANSTDRRVYSFSGNKEQNVVIDLEIQSDVELAEIEVVKHSGTTTTSIKDCEYAYDSSTKKLTVHVGNAVVDGKIYLTFWSAIA